MDFVLEESLGFMLNRAALKVKNNLCQSLKPFEVTPEQWGILNQLWVRDGISQKELADRSFKDQPNVTRMLDKLEEKGLIERRANPADRRAFLIFITPAGRELKNQLIPTAQAALDQALRGINQQERTEMKRLLKQIINNLE